MGIRKKQPWRLPGPRSHTLRPILDPFRLGRSWGRGTRQLKTPREHRSSRGEWHGACSEYLAGGSGVLTHREFSGALGLAPRPGMGATSDRPAEKQSDEAIVEERRVTVVRLLVLFCIPPLLWWNVIPPSSEPALTGLMILIASYVGCIAFLLHRLLDRPLNDLLL